jgi:hypothetical protein
MIVGNIMGYRPLLFILGPKDVTDDTCEVGILTRGLIHRNAGSNDHSRNFVSTGDTFPDEVSPGTLNVPAHALFRFPTGGGENVQNVRLLSGQLRKGMSNSSMMSQRTSPSGTPDTHSARYARVD